MSYKSYNVEIWVIAIKYRLPLASQIIAISLWGVVERYVMSITARLYFIKLSHT